jgi:hypothetical protein
MIGQGWLAVIDPNDLETVSEAGIKHRMRGGNKLNTFGKYL